MNDGGPAFPTPYLTRDGDSYSTSYADGMTLRDYFAIHAPEPTKDQIETVMRREQMANPHNEPYINKIRRRGEQEIRCALRYEYADAMIAERSKAPTTEATNKT